MNRWKEILRKIFFPSPWVTLLVAIPSFLLVIYVLRENNQTWIAYVSYACSGYALAISITGMKRLLCALKEFLKNLWIVRKLLENRFLKALITDVLFRSEVTLHGGLIASSVFASVQVYSAYKYSSAWSAALAGYYILLVVMRSMLVVYVHRHELTKDLLDEYRMYRKVGILLLLMNQALTVMVVYMVHQNEGAVYNGYMIYIMAIYAFYMTIISIINTIRFHKKNITPVLSGAKVISLTSALVSMLSLETAMIHEFSKRDIVFRRWMTGIFGGCICVFVLLTAIFMIVKSTKVIKEKEAYTNE